MLIGFVVVAPYMSMPRWTQDLEPPALHQVINPVWFSAFIVMSAFGNTGLSLVDQSMVPFQKAYPTIFLLALLISAGNTAFVSPV